ASDVARAEARGQALAAALGLYGVSYRVERLDDRFEHRIYDEVTSLDGGGREVAIARFELDGSVAMAVALGWHPAAGRTLDGPAAARRAETFVHAAGLSPAGRAVARPSAGGGGWSIAWPRVVAGATVRGDGLRVTLWPDGTFHGLTRTERPLAPTPGRQIRADEARQAAASLVAVGAGESAADLRVIAVERTWIAPNDLFATTRVDAPATTLRLAWAVRFDAVGSLAERVRSLEVWLDAGDGSLLGGDVIE
ncbi:MAG: hypothetical protein ABIQ76_05065, partial [Candidatus Limnocylindrales bacterium]